MELSLGEASNPLCASRVSRVVQLHERLAFVLARERQIPLGGARLSPQRGRFDPLPVFGQRALAFSRFLAFQSIEIISRGRYGVLRLTIILLRLDHECGPRRRDGEGGRENSGGEKQGHTAAPRQASRTAPKPVDESIVGGGEANSL